MTTSEPQGGCHPKPTPPARTAAPRPPSRPADAGRRGPSHRRSAPIRPRRPGRHRLADHLRRRTGHRLVAGRRHRGGVRAFRPPLRRSGHRGRADGGRLASGTGDARKIKSRGGAPGRKSADGRGARRRRRVGRPAGDDRRARRLRGAGRARAARRAPGRANRPQGGAGRRGRGIGGQLDSVEGRRATGCARSSTSGAPSPGWTARPTTRCGSGTRRHARPSTGAAGRISPTWIANGSAPARPRRRCASAPRNYPTPPSGARTGAVFRDLLTAVEGSRPGGQGCRRRAVAAVQGGPGQVLRRPQRSELRTRRRVPRQRRSEGGVAGRGRKASTPTDPEAARAALRAIDEKWDAIGKVPRERGAELERRLRAVEKKVRDAASSGWADPEAQARADQFTARAEQFERQAEKAEAGGRTKDAEEARANAAQWRQWAEAAADALGKKR